MKNTGETLQFDAEAMRLRKKKKAKRATYVTLIHLALIITSLLFVFPLIWMVSVSLQSEEEMRLANGFWDMLVPNDWLWSNYAEVFRAIPFMRYFKNSAIVTSLTVVGTVLASSLVSYAFSKLRWPGRNFVYTLMLATMILPSFILMIPTFKMYSKMGFVDTWVPLILPAFLGGGAGNIILIQQFFMSIPKEMSEAAMIDGAKHTTIWLKIMLPLCAPVLATVAIFSFLFSWNDYLQPLIYVNSASKQTIAQGLRAFQSQTSTRWGLLMAGSLISMIPNLLLFVFCQRFFLEGVKAGSVKG